MAVKPEKRSRLMGGPFFHMMRELLKLIVYCLVYAALAAC